MENKAAPEKQKLSIGSSFASFKPSLNTTSNAFVPTSAPKVDFSPQKGENKEADGNLSVKKFDLNAPLFVPTFIPQVPVQ